MTRPVPAPPLARQVTARAARARRGRLMSELDDALGNLQCSIDVRRQHELQVERQRAEAQRMAAKRPPTGNAHLDAAFDHIDRVLGHR